jgi:hypothetical protein
MQQQNDKMGQIFWKLAFQKKGGSFLPIQDRLFVSGNISAMPSFGILKGISLIVIPS